MTHDEKKFEIIIAMINAEWRADEITEQAPAIFDAAGITSPPAEPSPSPSPSPGLSDDECEQIAEGFIRLDSQDGTIRIGPYSFGIQYPGHGEDWVFSLRKSLAALLRKHCRPASDEYRKALDAGKAGAA